jgi:hypothetical protein
VDQVVGVVVEWWLGEDGRSGAAVVMVVGRHGGGRWDWAGHGHDV